MRYAVVIEKTETGYSAWVPDLPGCVSVGRTREEMNRNIREAIELYLDELREQGAPIAAPRRTPNTLLFSIRGGAAIPRGMRQRESARVDDGWFSERRATNKQQTRANAPA